MTVPATTRRAGPFPGNGSTTSFPFEFNTTNAAEVQVVRLTAAGVSVPLVKDSDYTVTLNADQEATPGGSITYPITGAALPVGESLTIAGAVPYSQEADLPTGGAYRASSVEQALDRAVVQVQQLAEEVSRSLRIPLADGASAAELPPASQRIDKALVGDSAGNLVFVAPASGSATELGSMLQNRTLPARGGSLVGHGLDLDYGGAAGDPQTVAQAIQEVLGTKSFTLYVSTTGNDSNTGTSASPLRSLQAAFNRLMAVGTVGGTRRIILSAGTWSGASYRSSRLGPANATESVPNTNYQTGGISAANYIVIEGADVGYVPASNPRPVPTTIFDGGGAAAIGIQLEAGLKVLVKNIKFQNYSGSSSSAGISNDGGMLRCENVHGSANNMDISSMRGRLEVKGGRLDGATQYSIRSIFLNKHEIGNQAAGAVGQGPLISNANIGLFAQEGATGHSDYVTYEDCTDAIRATVNSRVNFSGSEFKRCQRGVRADANAVVFYSTANFYDGTADACTENVIIQQGATDVTRDSYANTGCATDYAGPVSHTGTTTSTPILTKTLPRSRFAPTTNSVRKPQHIRFTAFGSISGSAGTKQFKLRLGSTVLASITNTATDTAWRCDGVVVFTTPTDQKAQLTYVTHNANSKVATDTGTDDMRASDVSLTFEVQLANAADTVVVEQAFFEVWG